MSLVNTKYYKLQRNNINLDKTIFKKN